MDRWLKAWRLAVTLVLVVAGPCPGGFDVVAELGDPSPDGNGALSAFGAPLINAQGEVAFYANLSGSAGGTADNLGLFRYGGELSDVIARSGVTQVGGETVTSFITNDLILTDTGSLFFWSATASGFRITTGDGGAVTEYAPAGSPSPSGGNSLLTAFFPRASSSGAAVYSAIYVDGNENLDERGAYLRSPAGAQSIVALEGDPAPGGGVYTTIASQTVNRHSEVAFRVSVDDGVERSAVHLRRNGANTELIRERQFTTDGVQQIFSIDSVSAINNNGGVAFSGDYEEGPLFPEGVFAASEGKVELLASGVLPGGSFAARDIAVNAYNDSGQALFLADVGPSFLTGLYLADGDAVSLITLDNSPAPGTSKFIMPFSGATVSMNNRADVIFFARLSDTPGGFASGAGLFRYTPYGGLETILTTEDQFLGSQVTGLAFTGQSKNLSQGGNTTLSGLNELGQVSFLYALEDGSLGVAVWSPEQLAGDYNGDGLVDAGDYTVWRDNLGSPAGAFPNDTDGGTIGLAQYETWKNHYGGAASGFSAPEPDAAAMVLPFLIGLARRRQIGKLL